MEELTASCEARLANGQAYLDWIAHVGLQCNWTRDSGGALEPVRGTTCARAPVVRELYGDRVYRPDCFRRGE